MNNTNNIRKINGHTNCHTKNARASSSRLVSRNGQFDSRPYLYGRRTKQKIKVFGRMGTQRLQKNRSVQKPLGNKMEIRNRMLQRLHRLRMVQTNELAFIIRERIRARREMCLRRKNIKRVTI
jgi:hypothetical protein